MRVLVIAYACEPGKSSEPGVGWNFVREIAKFAEATVITRANNREVIEQAQGRGLSNKVTWIYVDLPGWARWLKKRIPFSVQVYYALWQLLALLKARKVARRDTIDLVHHLTFSMTWSPPATIMMRQPVLWGPVGGGDFVPQHVLTHERKRSIAREMLYRSLCAWAWHVSPLGRHVRGKAAGILFRTRSAESRFPPTATSVRGVIPETSLETAEAHPRNRARYDQLGVLCLGRLTYWKGFWHAVRAFDRYLQCGGRGALTIVGDGPERRRIQRYVEQRGLEERIRLVGAVPRERVPDYLSQADVLLHPSFRDGGSWSVLEAMSKGIPVVCLAQGGPADMTGNEGGVCVEPADPESLVRGLAEALVRLEQDKDEWLELSRGAARRARCAYNWERRGREVAAVYARVLTPQRRQQTAK